MEQRKVEYLVSKSCNRNPEYPKVRLVCGEVQMIRDRDAVLEFLYADETVTRWNEFQY